MKTIISKTPTDGWTNNEELDLCYSVERYFPCLSGRTRAVVNISARPSKKKGERRARLHSRSGYRVPFVEFNGEVIQVLIKVGHMIENAIQAPRYTSDNIIPFYVTITPLD